MKVVRISWGRAACLAASLGAVFAWCFSPTRVNAAPAVYDGFNYPSGQALQNQSGGTGFGNTWNASANFNVGSGSLGFGALLTSGNDVAFSQSDLSGNEAYRTLTPATTLGTNGTTAWVSFLLRPDATPADTEYYLQIGDANLGKAKTTDAFYSLDVANVSTASTVPIVSGQTVFLVAEFQFNASGTGNDTVSLFVNPTPGLATPDTAAITDSHDNLSSTLSTIALFAANGAHASFDEVRIGGSYADVSPSSVPEPGAAALLALGVAAVGCYRFRFFLPADR